jgi:hypothetical protein
MREEQYLRSKGIYQRVRCMACNNRMGVKAGQREVTCPACNQGWVVMWVTPDLPMVLRRISPAYWPEGSDPSKE